MKRILTATDFSKTAKNAVYYAADMANRLHAHLYILHVSEIPSGFVDVALAANLDINLKDAEKAMEELKQEIQLLHPGLLVNKSIKQGMMFDEINNLCKILHPYCIVIGNKGKSFTEFLLYGNHAVHIMRHSSWPVITVPLSVSFSGINNIGFACDFTEVVETTPIDEISILVNQFNAKLHIINTQPVDVINPQTVFESAMLQEMMFNLQPTYHTIKIKDIDEGIVSFCDSNHIDLLIVLPKRHGLLELLHKSHTKHLVLHSHVPVIALQHVP